MVIESKQTKDNIPLIPVVGGLVPFTTIDFPKKISCVVFLQGCPWRCIYCSNPQLFPFREPTERDAANWEYVLDLVRKRTKALEAIVFSGGEATSQAKAVASAIEQIHEISPHYQIGLHTNGCDLEGLKLLLPLVDWIGLDIKAPRDRYDTLTKVENSADPAFKALDMILKSGKAFEVRTTCDPRLLDKDAILALAAELAKLGVQNYALQRFRPHDKTAPGLPSQAEIMQFFADAPFEEKLKALIPNTILRW
jgi:anaerobic ribonucleoside-triphosphate reductase activating protein